MTTSCKSLTWSNDQAIIGVQCVETLEHKVWYHVLIIMDQYQIWIGSANTNYNKIKSLSKLIVPPLLMYHFFSFLEHMNDRCAADFFSSLMFIKNNVRWIWKDLCAVIKTVTIFVTGNFRPRKKRGECKRRTLPGIL